MPQTDAVEQFGRCESDDTTTDRPCQKAATYPDGRCGWHTDCDESEKLTADRPGRTQFRIVDETHARLSEHQREGETLSGTIGRALDALEREQRLPDAVAEVLADG